MNTKPKVFAGWLLLAICLSGGGARAGTEILLYPFARMFGSPSEGELARCRAADSLMQTNFDRSHVVVMSVLFADADSDSKSGQWRGDLAAALAREMTNRTTAKIEVSASEPEVAMAKPFKNQLRYATNRSAACGAWVKAAHPPGDFVFFAEIFGGQGFVYAIQIYVFDSSGQLAYSRQLNSHQFGNHLPLTGDAAVKRIVKTFMNNLKEDVNKYSRPISLLK